MNNQIKILLVALLILSINALYTRKIVQNKYKDCSSDNTCSDEQIKI